MGENSIQRGRLNVQEDLRCLRESEGRQLVSNLRPQDGYLEIIYAFFSLTEKGLTFTPQSAEEINIIYSKVLRLLDRLGVKIVDRTSNSAEVEAYNGYIDELDASESLG